MTVLTEATDTTPATTKTTAKPFEQWSEEDRRLVQLDAKLRNMVLASVPKMLVPILVPHLTTKSMFDQLVDQNKGNAKSIKAQKVALNKAYETFFAKATESLTETYVRFSNLIIKLNAIGPKKDEDLLVEKFCDIFPRKYEDMIGTMRHAETL